VGGSLRGLAAAGAGRPGAAARPPRRVGPGELRRRQATLRGVRASVARQRQRLLEAYLAEVVDLACFQRQDRGLAGQEADLLAASGRSPLRASGWSR
jgi:hypothetical protein